MSDGRDFDEAMEAEGARDRRMARLDANQVDDGLRLEKAERDISNLAVQYSRMGSAYKRLETKVAEAGIMQAQIQTILKQQEALGDAMERKDNEIGDLRARVAELEADAKVAAHERANRWLAS